MKQNKFQLHISREAHERGVILASEARAANRPHTSFLTMAAAADGSAVIDLRWATTDFGPKHSVEFGWSSQTARSEATYNEMKADLEAWFSMGAHKYRAQSARDAQAGNYGEESYWDYLETHAKELFDFFTAKGQHERASEMFTRSLSDSLVGNDGI
jgi:hypothetical protein